ncbi:MAG: hypothetical protein GY832_14995 [Chloroflexi bacterium]|nr:hypothetical protein [Chloroflexota bacterium]
MSTITACTTTVPSPTPSPPALVEPTTAVPTATFTATPTATLTPTPTPTPTLTPTPTATPTVTPTPTPLPDSILLEPMNHQAQTMNNCGPASIAILLGYYDYWATQHEVRSELENAPESLTQRPCNFVWYISQYDLAARVYYFPLSRDQKLLTIRALLANDVPVIVMQRLEIGSSIGHFRVIQGYDDAAGEFISDDPLLGVGYRIPYDVFIRLGGGGPFFIPVYPPNMDAQVQAMMTEVGASRWTKWDDGLSCADMARQ